VAVLANQYIFQSDTLYVHVYTAHKLIPVATVLLSAWKASCTLELLLENMYFFVLIDAFFIPLTSKESQFILERSLICH